MVFDYRKSEPKHVLDYYDGIPLILVMTYEGRDYLMYAIDWDMGKSSYEYMLTMLTAEACCYVQKKGVLSYLQKQLASAELYHLTTGLCLGEQPDSIRLLSEDEANDAFPKEEFRLDFPA